MVFKYGIMQRGLRAEYAAWIHMRRRCGGNPNHPQAHNYAGRGITVCQEWQDNFEAFIKDMGRRPEGDGTRRGEYSIDRIDNNLGYSKENCRWATRQQQQRNMSSNHRLTLNGETKIIHDWAKHLGISPHTIVNRLRRPGCTTEEALRVARTPPRTEGWYARHKDGQKRANGKLNVDDVRAIRASNEPYKVLAKRYDICTTTIGHVKNRITWGHLPD